MEKLRARDGQVGDQRKTRLVGSILEAEQVSWDEEHPRGDPVS
uniref:Uncharacterized protein n=1 Tax=Peronospora matthiolae TaxID=2874970 RepID=A0AAV1TAK3_9STRA